MTSQEKDYLNGFIEDYREELSKPVREIDWSNLYKKLDARFNDEDQIIKAFYSLINNLPEVKKAGGFVKWSGVKRIERYYYPIDSTAITIPEGVKEIDDAAFWGYANLKSVIFPKGLKEINSWAFNHCTNLTSITIPNGVSKIGIHAFYVCSSLTSITLPEGLEELGDWAFAYCPRLTSITIPEGVKEIGADAFFGCNNLTSIALPKSLKKIEEGAFSQCPNLKSITYPGTKADWAKVEIGEQYQWKKIIVKCTDGKVKME